MLAVLAPGQGAQTPGYLASWLTLPDVASRMRTHSSAVGTDLARAGTHADDAALVDTELAQPLLVASGVAVAAALGPLPGDAVIAGHSVGEITAAVLAGAMDAETALRFVQARGRAMAAASTIAPSGMTAVLGGDVADVLAAIEAAGCVPANRNGAGQIVAAGTTSALQRLSTAPPAGARLRPLRVAGAFHTNLMQSAEDALLDTATRLTLSDPQRPLLSNADGSVVDRGGDLLRRLVRQVSRPVRWDLCLQTLANLGVTATIELPPAGTLTAIVRRELPNVQTLALRSPDDLASARKLMGRVAGSAGPDMGRVAGSAGRDIDWRLVVSPASGTWKSAAFVEGATVSDGATVGAVVSRRAETAVVAVPGGTLVEWLVRDGDPVAASQPVARLSPAGTA